MNTTLTTNKLLEREQTKTTNDAISFFCHVNNQRRKSNSHILNVKFAMANFMFWSAIAALAVFSTAVYAVPVDSDTDKPGKSDCLSFFLFLVVSKYTSQPCAAIITRGAALNVALFSMLYLLLTV